MLFSDTVYKQNHFVHFYYKNTYWRENRLSYCFKASLQNFVVTSFYQCSKMNVGRAYTLKWNTFNMRNFLSAKTRSSSVNTSIVGNVH